MNKKIMLYPKSSGDLETIRVLRLIEEDAALDSNGSASEKLRKIARTYYKRDPRMKIKEKEGSHATL